MALAWIKRKLKHFFGLDSFEFGTIRVKREVLDAISEFAKNAHPKEFIMFFQGKVKDNALNINSLYYLEYFASEDSAMPVIRLPLFSDIVGSVHSHPGPSNRPSRADLQFFQKHGMFHMIIRYPYRLIDIRAYTISGQPATFEVFE